MQLPEMAGAVPAAAERTGKRRTRSAILLFVLGMLLLTLFSNTLLNVSLPRVTLEQAAPGALQHIITGAGQVEAANTIDAYTDSGWPVDKVNVEVGDRVKAGQTLIAFDTKAAKESLEDDRTRCEQKRIALDKLHGQYTDAYRSGNAEQVKSVNLDIRSAELDLQLMERQISREETMLAQQSSVKAAADGVVVELNAVKGVPVQAGQAAVRIADPSAGQRIRLLLDTDQAERLVVGDTADAVFESLDNARIEATVEAIRAPSPAGGEMEQPGTDSAPPQDVKEVVLKLRDERLTGGETGEWTIVKKMKPSPLLLPNAAIRQDADGAFVLVLKERKGPLGSEYTVQQVPVDTGDSDDASTEVGRGLSAQDRIVVSSSKPVADGDRVLILQ